LVATKTKNMDRRVTLRIPRCQTLRGTIALERAWSSLEKTAMKLQSIALAFTLTLASSLVYAQGGSSGGSTGGGASSSSAGASSAAGSSNAGSAAAGTTGSNGAPAGAANAAGNASNFGAGTTTGLANPSGSSPNGEIRNAPSPPPGTNMLGTAQSSGLPGGGASAPTRTSTDDTDAKIDSENRRLDDRVKSICRGC
jgi:hypothetical protein